ncbi:MFS transporter [Massilia sp. S19_KUP03_FR1]|uniref:MFS transporter n=1 Tax=Massilia sp. S19_KUP03_FR1 TaxID=3025503 RepID=UPI002FCDC5BC
MHSANSPATRFATRLLFLVAGFGYACWAPLVPLTKIKFGIDENILGLLILCIGVGSITAMVATGMLATRFGSKPILLGSGIGFAVMLALVPVAGSVPVLGIILFGFGATLGALDVAMNLQAVQVEKAAQRPMMSGFHALFSIGGFSGAAFMTFLLSMQVAVFTGTLICAALMALALFIAAPRLIDGGATPGGPMFALPRGLVLLLAILAAVTFLVEGALLDWSALLITQAQLVPVAQGGIGYIIFSVAMTAGRLSGDWLSGWLGDFRTLLWGGLVALLGFVILLTGAQAALVLSGFAFIGLGCANIVPVLFRRAAAQGAMPPALAVAAVTTTGYAGILAGPAVIGFVANATGLHAAFWMLAGLLVLVPLCARSVTAKV